VAASNYSVNIKLNTKPARVQLEALEKRVNKLRTNLNKPLRIESKAVTLQKQQLQLQDRKFATMKITARLGNQVRRFEEQGLKVDKLRLEIKNASRHLDKGRIETARSANKFVADELKAIEKALQANIQSAGVDRNRVRTLGQLIALKRTEASLNRTAGSTAAFMDSQRKGIGPNNLLGLPSSKMLNARDRGIQVLDPLSRAGSTGFTAAQYGPQLPSASQIKALGTGPVGMDINTRFAQQKKRIKFQHDLNMLEVKGVRTTKLRAKMGELVDAQNRKQFGSIQRINNELENGILKLKNQLKLTAETNKKQNQIASGKFARGGNFGRIGGKIGPALPPNMAPRGFDFQSAAISGAFPLLFGQGPLAALGGGLGGGFGGQFGGQMGGFAGGLIGTAVVTGLQAQVTAVAQLGQAFNSVTPNIEALTGALGLAGTEEEKRLKLIEKQQGAQAALSHINQKMNELIGENGVKSLKEFGDSTRLLSNAFVQAMTKFKATLAPLLSMLAKPLTGQLSKKEQERLAGIGGAETDETLLTLEEELGGIRPTKQNRAKRNRIKSKIADRKEELALFGQSIERANNLRLIENDLVRKNRQKNELLQATIDGNKEQVQLSQDIAAEVQKRLDAGFAIIEIDIKDIENQIKKTKELEKQAEIAEQIEQSFKDMVRTIATDLSDGIKGLIRGTSTLNDVLRNVMDKLVDAALNMALFGNVGGKLFKGVGLFGSIFGGFLSTGGPAKAGKSYIVGEKGPELFTPGVSGTVSPNSSLGGSTNIVVNVDASGSSVEGDEQQGKELGRLISVAIQSELIQQKRPGGLLA